LGKAVAGGDRLAPDDDDQAAKYEIADDRLADAGLHWYEISNWCVPGEECRHNLLYWRQGEYAGIGCAAHGHTVDPATGAARRCWNVRTPERYLAAIAEGGDPEAGAEQLDPSVRQAERLTLLLRTREGIKLERADAELPRVESCVDELVAGGLVEVMDGRLSLTRRGRLLANEVSARLLAALSSRPTSAVSTPTGVGTR
jgi:oxygen-independent coproporphyrinogen-3 oxidase